MLVCLSSIKFGMFCWNSKNSTLLLLPAMPVQFWTEATKWFWKSYSNLASKLTKPVNELIIQRNKDLNKLLCQSRAEKIMYFALVLILLSLDHQTSADSFNNINHIINPISINATAKDSDVFMSDGGSESSVRRVLATTNKRIIYGALNPGKGFCEARVYGSCSGAANKIYNERPCNYANLCQRDAWSIHLLQYYMFVWSLHVWLLNIVGLFDIVDLFCVWNKMLCLSWKIFLKI